VSTETTTKPALASLAEARARRMLEQLKKADAAVRCFPEPRSGPAFESAQRTWSATYARAIAMGAEFEEESA
jgi:hypothetical protein